MNPVPADLPKPYVDLGDGYSHHIESSLEGVTLCGRRFDADDVVERIDYNTKQLRWKWAGDKPSYCFDCLVVHQGGSVHPRRREIHF